MSTSGRKKRGLGRGLDELLGGSKKSPATKDGDYLLEVEVSRIQPGEYQPRTGMDQEKLQELADSIAAQGLVQPVVIRPKGRNTFELIAGERRWRAAQLAGLSKIPALVKDIPDQATMAMSLIENIQREDLNPLEEAMALDRLLKEFELTHQQAAEAVGRSRAAVSNLLRLLDLHPPAKELLEQGKLDMGHARALLPLGENLQRKAALEIVQKQLSVRDAEALVRRLLEPEGDVATKKEVDPDISRLEKDLSDRLCTAVALKHQSTGKGQIVIRYSSLDELDGILGKIQD